MAELPNLKLTYDCFAHIHLVQQARHTLINLSWTAGIFLPENRPFLYLLRGACSIHVVCYASSNWLFGLGSATTSYSRHAVLKAGWTLSPSFASPSQQQHMIPGPNLSQVCPAHGSDPNVILKVKSQVLVAHPCHCSQFPNLLTTYQSGYAQRATSVARTGSESIPTLWCRPHSLSLPLSSG